ncbi:MAG: NAD(P)H-hydrate dehydratase [Ferruginibacter sp.]
MKIFSAPQIKEWDHFTISNEPVTSLGLMERAANACCGWIAAHYPSRPLYIFCGPGNNGGDGLAIARLLHTRQFRVKAYILAAEKHSADFDANLGQLPLQPVAINSAGDFPEWEEEAVLIDALFGTGLHTSLSGLSAALVTYINNGNAPVVSIDLPSGMFTDASSKGNRVIQATHTLSFQCYKQAFMMTENLAFTGQVHLLDIHLLPQYYQVTDTDRYSIDKVLIKNIYRPRSVAGHKYNFGHALIFAGSKTMMGAALLCSKACMRAGAGLATLHIAAEQMPVLHTAVPEIIASPENDFSVLEHKKNAIALGPGLEVNEDNLRLLNHILEEWKGNLVIDASGLALLTHSLSILKKRAAGTSILTPHTGEFEKLFGACSNDFERTELALQQAASLQCYIVLKAPHTLIACPDGTAYFNTTGNSGMATAGSGDVLTGIIAGLLAQQYDAREACILGVYLHGLAGDKAAAALSKEAMMAGDIIEHVGAAFLSISRDKTNE